MGIVLEKSRKIVQARELRRQHEGLKLSGRPGPSSRIRSRGFTARVFEFEDRSPLVRLSAKGFAAHLESTSFARQYSCLSRCMLRSHRCSAASAAVPEDIIVATAQQP